MSKSSLPLFLLFVICMGFSSLDVMVAYADSFTAITSGSWFDSDIWDIDGVPGSGDDVDISYDISVSVERPVIIDGVSNGGVLEILDKFTVNGIFTNSGLTIGNSDTSDITINDRFTSSGEVENLGSFTFTGPILSPGEIKNNGTMTFKSDDAKTSGLLLNYGLMFNNGSISSSANLENYGVFTNSGPLFSNHINSNVTNNGILNNICNGLITSNGKHTGNAVVESACIPETVSPTDNVVVNDDRPLLTWKINELEQRPVVFTPLLNNTLSSDNIDLVSVSTFTAKSLSPVQNGNYSWHVSAKVDPNYSPGYPFISDDIPSPVVPFEVYVDPPEIFITSDIVTSGGFTDQSPIPIKITFTEPVTGFNATTDVNIVTDIQYRIENFAGSDDSYAFDIIPSSDGTIQLTVPANVVQDAAGNSNIESDEFIVNYDAELPTITSITSPTVEDRGFTNQSSIPFTIIFSESVTDFEASDVVINSTTNSQIDDFDGSGNTYTFNLILSGDDIIQLMIPSGAVQDVSGNRNDELSVFTLTLDIISPAVSITSSLVGGNTLTNQTSIPFTITFTEPVTGFEQADIAINSTTGHEYIDDFDGSDNTYTFDLLLLPNNNGTIQLTVPANVARDAAGNSNEESVGFIINYDAISPTVSVTSDIVQSGGSTNQTSIPIKITFTEPVTGFNVTTDVNIVNATIQYDVTDFADPGTTYTFDIMPNNNGTIQLTVPANVARDAAGNSNEESVGFIINYDAISPTVSVTSDIVQSGDTVYRTSIPIKITFTEPVTGFNATTDVNIVTDIQYRIENFAGSDDSYAFDIIPSSDGTIQLTVPANVVQDAAGNSNTKSNTFRLTYEVTVPPTVDITSSVVENGGTAYYTSMPITVTFSEPVTGFNPASDVNIVNAIIQYDITNFADPGTTYTFDIIPSRDGTIQLTVPSGVAQNTYGNVNTAYDKFTINYPDRPLMILSQSSEECIDLDDLTYTINVYANNCKVVRDQQWDINADGTITSRLNNMCIGVLISSSSSSIVYLDTCNNDTNQQWDINADGTITSRLNNECMSVQDYDTHQATDVTTDSCQGNDNQKWIVFATDVHMLKHGGSDSNRCLAINYNVEVEFCDGSTSQQWHLATNGGIISLENNRCLDVAGGSNADGTPVLHWSCHFAPNQQWEITHNGKITPASNRKCMEADYFDGNTFMQTCTLSDTVNQKWSSVSVDPLTLGTEKRIITINHDKVSGDRPLTDYPLLVSFTDASLQSARTDGSDILFTDINNNLLSFEIESWEDTTGTIVAWVKIPVLSASQDTSIYMHYGNPARFVSLADSESLWSNDAFVTHFALKSGISPVTDSTASHTFFVDYNTSGDVAGKIGPSRSFDGLDDWIRYDESALPSSDNPRTLSVWVNPDTLNTGWHGIAAYGTPSGSGIPVGSVFGFFHNDNNLWGGGYGDDVDTNHDLIADTWTKLDMTYDGTTVITYVNGEQTATEDKNWNTLLLYQFRIGQQVNSASEFFTGSIDEVRISNLAKSADYIKTEYMNQNDPGSFYTIIAEPIVLSTIEKKIITINHDKVLGDRPLTDYPLLVSFTDASLQSARADGADITFTDTSNDILAFEIESWDSITGTIVSWVKIPALSSDADTVIYLHYNDPLQAISLADPSDVWNNDAFVAHFIATTDDDDSISDSSANNAVVADRGTSIDVSGGKIGTARSFDGATWIDYDDSALPSSDNPRTLSLWAKPDTLNTGWHGIAAYGTPSGSGIPVGSVFGFFHNDNNLWGGGYGDDVDTNHDLIADTWTKLDMTYDGTTVITYVNGEQTATEDKNWNTLLLNQFRIGQQVNTARELFTGSIDEVRISNLAKSADYIKTEYLNQYDPGLFYSITPEPVLSTAEKRIITINHDKVSGDRPLTDYPLLVSFTDASLQSARTDGADILFTDISNNILSFEIESWDNSTGTIVSWVKIPELSTSQDTSIYMYYNNPARFVSLADPESVWSNDAFVTHFTTSRINNNPLSTSSSINEQSSFILTSFNDNLSDSTVNHAAFVNHGTSLDILGKMGTARSFVDPDWIDYDDSALPSSDNPRTLSLWAKPDTLNTGWHGIAAYGTPSGSGIPVGSVFGFFHNDNNLWGGGYSDDVDTNHQLITDRWTKLDMTYGYDNVVNTYVNGEQTATEDKNWNTLLLNQFRIGQQVNSASEFFTGSIDEVRVSNVEKPADYIKTEYMNQNDPGSFYTITTPDTTPPIITLVGNNPQIIDLNTDSYTELGATTDDGSPIRIDDSSFVDAVGSYRILYNSEDSAGNPAIQVSRIVTVVDFSLPVDGKIITINHNKVSGNSPLTDYPLLVSFTDASLQSARADGTDFVFTDTDNNILSFEIESWDSTTGTIVSWVKIPRLSSNIDTVIYLHYNNPLQIISQANPELVWDNDYLAVYHMSGTDDSTIHNNDGTNSGTISSTQGKISDSRNFDGVNDRIILPNDNGLNLLGDAMTISAWVNADVTSGAHVILGKSHDVSHNSPYYEWLLFQAQDTYHTRAASTTLNAGVVTANSWQYVTSTYDGVDLTLYVDGILESSVPKTDLLQQSSQSPTIGGRNTPSNNPDSESFDGQIDEVRISNVTKSAHWIETEWNNQNDLGSFYTVETVLP